MHPIAQTRRLVRAGAEAALGAAAAYYLDPVRGPERRAHAAALVREVLVRGTQSGIERLQATRSARGGSGSGARRPATAELGRAPGGIPR